MLLYRKNVIVTGFGPGGIAAAIAERVLAEGGSLELGLESERRHNHFLERVSDEGGYNQLERDIMDQSTLHFFDITNVEQIKAVRHIGTTYDGVVHCVAFGNRKTILGDNNPFPSDEDLQKAFDVSAWSFDKLVGNLELRFSSNDGPGASLVALTFEPGGWFPRYNWMASCKRALESRVQHNAATLGKYGIRANCLAAGPQDTMSAKVIKDYDQAGEVSNKLAPLGWDEHDRRPIANAVIFLLSDLSRGITGETIHVDGGLHFVAYPPV